MKLQIEVLMIFTVALGVVIIRDNMDMDIMDLRIKGSAVRTLIATRFRISNFGKMKCLKIPKTNLNYFNLN